MIARRSLLAAGAALSLPAYAQPARVLKFVPQTDLATLDPIWTISNVARNHGYMVWDTLYGTDAQYRIRPQMAEGWAQDGLVWTFRLRVGLVFHDGVPVLARDCVASIRRWMARDSLGQALSALTDALTATDDRTIVFRLKKPFPMLPLALAKPSPMPLFIMPERVALTDPFKAITDATGSGPFRFVANEWNPGSRAVWERHGGYVARDEAVSGIAGGKRAMVDRVEWTVIPDSATATAAMLSGEHDYIEYPIFDLLPLLRKSANVRVGQRLSTGQYAGIRINHLQAPFNNVKVRQALLLAIDQSEYMRAVAGEPEDANAPGGRSWEVCESVYTCGTAYAGDIGNAALRTRSIEKARAALLASGYNGERTVLIAPSDYPQINALSLVTADIMKRMGFNLDLVATDWGTVTTRRANQGPVEKGGWSVFHSTWSGTDVQNPAIHQNLRANGNGAWFGWPDDPEIERLRDAWMEAPASELKPLADRLQIRAFETVPFVPLGYYWQPSAWNKSVTGIFPCPVTGFWNIGKA
jgi:peptide/nickel transport system substrate-binding protein